MPHEHKQIEDAFDLLEQLGQVPDIQVAVVSCRARSPPHLGRDLPRSHRISISLAAVVSCPVLGFGPCATAVTT